MKAAVLQLAPYLCGPAVVLAVAALAVLPALLVPAGIPVTAPVDHTAASLTGLAASLAGALVLGGSFWWVSRNGGTGAG